MSGKVETFSFKFVGSMDGCFFGFRGCKIVAGECRTGTEDTIPRCILSLPFRRRVLGVRIRQQRAAQNILPPSSSFAVSSAKVTVIVIVVVIFFVKMMRRKVGIAGGGGITTQRIRWITARGWRTVRGDNCWNIFPLLPRSMGYLSMGRISDPSEDRIGDRISGRGAGASSSDRTLDAFWALRQRSM